MKVAYLLGSLNQGGTETLLLDVFRNADKVPFPFIGIHRKEGTLSGQFYAAGPKMILCNIFKLKFLRYLLALRRVLLAENITIVHAHQSLDCVCAHLATIGTNIHVVVTYHGYDFNANKLDRFISRLSSCWADEVCFVSQFQCNYYTNAYQIRKNKTHVVYNGIDFTKIAAAEASQEFLNYPNRIRLAMVGSFVEGRLQMIICKAIKNLKERGDTNFDFYFIGRRDDKEVWRYDECVQYCEKYKLTNVHFMGSQGDVPSLLKVMDGFVYSTAHDSFGIAVIEAIAAELPIVVNDWPVMKEVCNLGLPRNNNAIRFFRTEDVEDCARKMLSLMEDLKDNHAKIQTDCVQVAERVKGTYSIENYMNCLYKIYLSI